MEDSRQRKFVRHRKPEDIVASGAVYMTKVSGNEGVFDIIVMHDICALLLEMILEIVMRALISTCQRFDRPRTRRFTVYFALLRINTSPRRGRQ